MVDFSLRPMEPTDGPAIDGLMRNEAQTTAMSLTTRYRRDLYEAFLAQHPSTYGVVATSRGIDGLVGVATAFIDETSIGGRTYPTAHLENLKVRHDLRRHGLGARLAAWRIEEADRRFGGEGIIATGIEVNNTGSLATAHRWSTQVIGPVRVVIARVAAKRPIDAGVTVRPIEEGDLAAVVDAVNAFHARYDLYPRQTPSLLNAVLAPTAIGEPIRHYRVAVAGDGAIVAGAAVTERFKLMADHVEGIPLPLELLSRVMGLFPRDHVIRSIELSLAWHAPGQIQAGRHLWDAIRYEWRDRATHVAALADPRGSLINAFHVGRTLVPRVELLVPVRSPVPIDPARLVYVGR